MLSVLLFWIFALISWGLMLVAAVLFWIGVWNLFTHNDQAIYYIWTAYLLMVFGGMGHQYLFHV